MGRNKLSASVILKARVIWALKLILVCIHQANHLSPDTSELKLILKKVIRELP